MVAVTIVTVVLQWVCLRPPGLVQSGPIRSGPVQSVADAGVVAVAWLAAVGAPLGVLCMILCGTS